MVKDLKSTSGYFSEDSLAPFRDREDYELLEVVTRSALQPGSTVTSGWASELVTTVNSGFVSQLEPLSLVGQLFGEEGAIAITQERPGSIVAVPSRSATRSATDRMLAKDSQFR